MAELSDLTKTTKTNKSGFNHEVLLADRNWFATFGQPVNDGTPGSTVIIEDAHTFKTATALGLPAADTVGFTKVYCSEDTVKVALNANEGRDASGGAVEMELFIPGDEPAAEEWNLTASTKDLVLLVKDPNDKLNPLYYVQLGDENHSLQAKGSYGSEVGADGVKGFKVKVMGSLLSKLFYRPATAPTLYVVD
jgi:hypothetical protein